MVNTGFNKEEDTLTKSFYIDMINRAKEGELDGIEEQIKYPRVGGRRRNKPKNPEMKMDDVKRLCKNNQIKLSKTVNGDRVVYTKKELITKLKRKKLL